MTRVITVLKNENDVTTRLCKLIEEIAEACIERDDIFKVGLSGGSLINMLTKGLPSIETDWSKWKFFFCDERVVPLESADSNGGAFLKSLSCVIPVTDDQFVKIDPYLTAEEASKDYIQKMAVYFPPDSLPRFHCLLLGMGPDGHTCSLFPGHRLLEETSVWVAPIVNSPKPPASRITLTFPVVNNAEFCIFAITGSAKANMIKRVLIDEESLPAARVKLTDGELHWILDVAAASRIKGLNEDIVWCG